MSVRVSMSSPLISACSGLMYSGVPMKLPNSVKSVCSVSCCVVALAMPKSMTFGTGLPSCTRDEDVRGLQVAVDDALLVRVLDAVADLDEQLQPLVGSRVDAGRSTS